MCSLRHFQLVRIITFLTALGLVWLQVGPVFGGTVSQSRVDRENAKLRAEAIERASGLAPGLTQTPSAALRKKIEAKRRAAQAKSVADVRPLTVREMKSMTGRGDAPPDPLRNPYFDGTLPWQRSLRDVNLCNGNLFKSFTDIQVAPARGAGLVLQRTYNSNDARIGPFGEGWTHAYDIRIQEAKDVQDESGNPNAVPAQPAGEGGGDSTMNEVPRTDFFGAKHTYHRDADGLYSPPPYMYDELSSDYGSFLTNGPTQVLDDTDKGMDGTIKHYADVVTNADGTPGNDRACDYIQDRYGNRTTLSYDLSYTQADGSTRKLLTQVTDPTGRSLTFHWTNFGTTAEPAYRITEIDAPTDPTTGSYAYRVAYAYYALGDPDSGGSPYELKSVTLDPDGLNRTTTYTYTSCAGPYYDSSGTLQTATEYGLLASITDPMRQTESGHTVSYQYSACVVYGTVGSSPNCTQTVWVTQITEPGSGGPHIWAAEIIPQVGDLSSSGWQEIRYADNTPVDGYPYSYIHVGITESSAMRVLTITGGAGGNDAEESPAYLYEYNYDDQNNVTFKGTEQDNADTGQEYVYGQHGNVMSERALSGGGSYPAYWTVYPRGTDTAYYDGSQYFAKSSETDALGHTTTMGVGTDTAGNTGDPDPNIGDRGQTLWVRDAGYAVSGSPSYQKEATYTYNQYGQKLTETNMNGVVTQYTYGTTGDDLGNLVQVVQDPGDSTHLNRTTTMHYDVMGRVLQSTDPSGLTTTFAYNSLGQPTSVVAPARGGIPGETITYVYDANGRTHSVTDGPGGSHATTIAYESGNDRVSSVADSATGTTSYTYMLSGERKTMTLPGGGVLTYHYYADGSPSMYSTYSYEQMPKDDLDSVALMLSGITDDQGREIDFQTGARGVVSAEATDQTYDGGGNLLSYCETDYTYDSFWDGPESWSSDSPTWPPMGQLIDLTTTYHWRDGSGETHQRLLSSNAYTYDDNGQRLTNQIAIESPDASGAPQYTGGTPQYDSNGNATNEVTTTRTEAYAYDDLSRLKTVDYGDGETQSYTFDAMGNRMQKQDSAAGTTNYTVDAANRLLTAGANSCTSDADGNTLTDGTHVNTWDSQNRLVSSTVNGVTSTYTYGADGLRRSSTVNGVTTYYVYDGQTLIREMQGTPGNLHPSATYLNGPRGPEYRRDDSAVGTPVKWYVYDGLGSVVGEVDPSGNLTTTAKYDVYGAKRAGGTGTATSRQGFVGALGHMTDDETGLIYMRARYYDPGTGRFISEDPGANGNNWYVYADDNPVGNVDFSGEFSLASLNIGMAIGEGLASAGWDAALQQIMDGSVDWNEVAVAGGVGLVAGGVGAYARWAHYARTPLGRKVWQDAAGSFATYFQKFLGIGTGTSKQTMRLIPVWRSLLSGSGSRFFSAAYNGPIN